jgi:hypothetical protein
MVGLEPADNRDDQVVSEEVPEGSADTPQR